MNNELLLLLLLDDVVDVFTADADRDEAGIVVLDGIAVTGGVGGAVGLGVGGLVARGVGSGRWLCIYMSESEVETIFSFTTVLRFTLMSAVCTFNPYMRNIFARVGLKSGARSFPCIFFAREIRIVLSWYFTSTLLSLSLVLCMSAG